ncbi:MAG TPA: GIY-YIG nuclease family protein, partial [Thermomicrobiales bacterium]|nr:GIY-YIG nuclease family protein [Thermomicrobiales bacterium]
LGTTTERRSRNKVGRGRSLVDRSLLEGIPKKPGVYLMRDGDGRVIYVGKAKNLRERVSTYFSQPLGYARKMEGLLEAISRIDTAVVGSELEALLLEAQLIRRYEPRYNTAMRAFEHYPYIRVNLSNRWPRVTLVRDRKDDGARYFGPYRSRSAARKTVDVINDVLPLRTCTRSFKDARSYGNPCMRLALGKCLGPCVDTSIADEYRGMVHDVIRFLDGDDDALYQVLWDALEQAAERQDFERAEKLRRNLTVVNGIVSGQRELRQAVERHHLVLTVPAADPGGRELWLVLEGRIWSRISAGTPRDDVLIAETSTNRYGARATEDRVVDESLRSDSPQLEASVGDCVERIVASYRRYQECGISEVSHDVLDDTYILNRWIAGHADHPAVAVLDQERVHDYDYWRSIVRRAMRIPADELVLEVTGSSALAISNGDEAAESAPV